MREQQYESLRPTSLCDQALLLWDLGYQIAPVGGGVLEFTSPTSSESFSDLANAVDHAKECLLDDLFTNQIPAVILERLSFWDAVDGLLGDVDEYQRLRDALDGMLWEDSSDS